MGDFLLYYYVLGSTIPVLTNEAETDTAADTRSAPIETGTLEDCRAPLIDTQLRGSINVRPRPALMRPRGRDAR